ncbi:MAG: hypothetical protein IKN17_03905 [Ruminococcus sp.]|nr:hypothetical protein [Ruminococcus sp.]
MNVVGLWKIAKADKFDPSVLGLVEADVEDILADPEFSEEDKSLYLAKILFTEDGQILTLMDIPEDMPKEELDELVASGEFELYEDKLVIEKKQWKEENGVIKFDSGEKGEVLGEAVDPWREIPETEYGIKYANFGLVKE